MALSATPGMSPPHLKAVIFDVGGVVCRSPLLAIAAYEREHGIPNDYINCAITGRGAHGAWQRFERGEMHMFSFYEAFGRELSDTKVNNIWYANYCNRKGLDCPKLPDALNMNGRELFGRMMRESGSFDEVVVEAIRRIRGRWRVIALTNNFSKTNADSIGEAPPSAEDYRDLTVQSELAFLGWEDGPTPPRLRALFDDFCDSSTLGMRKPEPEFYLLACKRNGIQPHEAVFLDDLGMNLKVARSLGMETIRESTSLGSSGTRTLASHPNTILTPKPGADVPIGNSLGAIKKLEEKLGIKLTSVSEGDSQASHKL